VPVALPGQLLDKQRRDEIEARCREGNLFVSRADHAIYARHIGEQLDLVLLDSNLREEERVELFRGALTNRIGRLMEQPVQQELERLRADASVLTEYLWGDASRIREFFRRMGPEDGLAQHQYNVAIVGLGLYLEGSGGSPSRAILDSLALGLLTHDLGMSKIPAFILQKTTPLTTDEQNRIARHPSIGADLLRKLGVTADETLGCVLEHHERLDGSGYPLKKKGREIGAWGKIAAVADSFCAMISPRPHSPPLPRDVAGARLARDSRYDRRLTTILRALVVGG
jgi:HD-GYP domain-containing protein (c-di-GMP phosphodiesterase class II)